MMMNKRQQINKSKRCVIKIGSALLTNDGAGLNVAGIATWSEQIAALRKNGIEVVLVSSGAVAEGMCRLGIKKRPKALHELQVLRQSGKWVWFSLMKRPLQNTICIQHKYY